MRVIEIRDLPGSYGTTTTAGARTPNIGHADIWDRVARYNFDGIMVDLRQLKASGQNQAMFVLDFIRSRGKRAYVNIVPTDYDPDLTPTEEANAMADFIDWVSYQNTSLTAVFDDERHSAEGMEELIDEFRKRKALRDAIIAPEGMQGGWIADKERGMALPATINMDGHLRIARQNYVDNMMARDADATRLDLVNAGIKESKIIQVTSVIQTTAIPHVFQPLPIGWEGLAFCMEFLP